MPLGRTQASRSRTMCLLPRTICFSRPVSVSASKSSPPFAHAFVPHSSKHGCSGCSGCCVNTSALSSPRFSHVGSFSWISHDKCTTTGMRKPKPSVPCKSRETLLMFVWDLKRGITRSPGSAQQPQQQRCVSVLLSMERKFGVLKTTQCWKKTPPHMEKKKSHR